MNNKLNETFEKHLGLLKSKLNENETQRWSKIFYRGGDGNSGVKLVEKLEQHRNQLDTLLNQIYETLVNDGHSDISVIVGKKSSVVMDNLSQIINDLDNKYGKQ